jgi:sucrose phosphorylase
MHLPETHAAVQIMRDLLDDLAPGTLLITETNVPHRENVSYFGEGDEAHAVYQFSLAPLLLDAFLTGDAGPLGRWLSQLEYPGPGMTFFNFTASHDGIGVRPLEGLVSPDRLEALVQGVRERGGLVSTRTQPDGSESPYELNVSFFSAMGANEQQPAADHARRFLASQAFMLGLRGIPGIYFHSLVGTPNYHQGVQQTGRNRTINRRKFVVDELRAILNERDTAQRAVFDGYRNLLEIRINQPAFHPDAEQRVLPSIHPSLVAFRRTSRDESQNIVVAVNVGAEAIQLDVPAHSALALQRDLISNRIVRDDRIDLAPGETVWLV